MQPSKSLIQKSVIAVLLIFFIIITSLLFVYLNRERIAKQNSDYLVDAANQKASRLSYVMDDAQKNIGVLSYLFSQTVVDGNIDYQKMQKISIDSPFDYVEFIDADGKRISLNGMTTIVVDREYFKLGMQGQSGIYPIFDSILYGGNLVIFYTPLEVNNEIIGVLAGLYRAKTLEPRLYSSYFGELADTYLCTTTGDVVASYTSSGTNNNVIEYLKNNDKIDNEQVEKISNAFYSGTSYTFQYKNNNELGTIYATKIENTGFILMQEFPPRITQEMIREANCAGFGLVAVNIIALVGYIVWILFENYRQRKKIIKENTEMSYVISGTTRLFDKFILVDLEKNKYQYLANTYSPSERFPYEGNYDDLVGMLSEMIVYDDDKIKVKNALQPENIIKELGKNGISLRQDYYVQRKNKVWEALNIICLGHQDGKVNQVLLARQDINEDKINELKNNARLKEAYRAAEKANHAKSDFLSRMSHDIRTPMNAIMGMTSIAKRHIDDKARVDDCLNKITVSSNHLLGLINEVLDMSKIESGKIVLVEDEFNLAETIENVVTIFRPQVLKKNQKLNVSITMLEHENLMGDSQRLQQVFVNILGNSIKFTPEGGDICFSINEKSIDDTGRIEYEFVIRDSGIGMDKKFIEHIFEPFSRESDSRVSRIEGTGLGMSIANSIVNMMDGNIKVSSELGKGSEFKVTVYLKPSKTKEEHPECLNGLKILVLDEDPASEKNIIKIAQSIGMEIDIAKKDDITKKILEANSADKKYFALLLDIVNMDNDILDIVKKIRSSAGDDIWIILMSSDDWSSIIKKAYDAGVNDFISKPIFKSRFIHVMQNLAENKDGKDNNNLIEKNYKGKRILLVEDNELNTEIAVELLEMIGFEVDTACDGSEAVKKAANSKTNYYDLILMDIQMPKMNGYEATAAIRALKREDIKSIPIIAMSANAFSDDVVKSKEAGMNSHVAKPIEMNKLVETINKWIN